MAISDGLVALLLNNAGVTALTSCILPVGSVKGIVDPCIIYHIGTGVSTYTAKGDAGLPMVRFQFDCYSSKNRQTAMAVATAVRNALKSVIGQTLSDGTYVYACMCDPAIDLPFVAQGTQSAEFRVMVQVEVTYLG
jgi:hypothetical protein